jgi:phosphatidylinositol alpha-1,6-mannosyltransferase
LPPGAVFWHWETSARRGTQAPENGAASLKSNARAALLIATQFMSEGSGGIAEVARMTAKSLSIRFPTEALACQDRENFRFGEVAVRSFRNSRPRFVAGFALASLRATHIVHDFVGTARAQRFALGGRRGNAVWAHGVEVWGEPRPEHAEALRRADLVLVNSLYTMERAALALSGARNVRLCRLGTTDDAAPDFVGPGDGPPTVLLLGRIDPEFPKGHDLLVSIWPSVVSAVPDARLVFAGGGPALPEARQLAARSPVAASIEVVGFAPADKIDAIWRRATLMALPGVGEGFGLVFIEAMRRGVPVIASREDAGQEINLDGVTGFNISREKPEELADAIIALLRDRDAVARLGAAGHARWREEYCFSAFDRRLRAATSDFLDG